MQDRRCENDRKLTNCSEGGEHQHYNTINTPARSHTTGGPPGMGLGVEVGYGTPLIMSVSHVSSDTPQRINHHNHRNCRSTRATHGYTCTWRARYRQTAAGSLPAALERTCARQAPVHSTCHRARRSSSNAL